MVFAPVSALLLAAVPSLVQDTPAARTVVTYELDLSGVEEGTDTSAWIARTGVILQRRMPEAEVVVDGDVVRIALPPDREVDAARAVLERHGRIEFLPRAESSDFGGVTDEGTERARAEAWLAEQPGRTLEHFPAHPESLRWMPSREGGIMPVVVPEVPEHLFTAADIASASASTDELGLPAILVEMKPERAEAFGEFTGAIIDRRLAIAVDGVVLVTPTVASRLPGQALITGGPHGFTSTYVQETAAVLQGGELPAPLVLRGTSR